MDALITYRTPPPDNKVACVRLSAIQHEIGWGYGLPALVWDFASARIIGIEILDD